MKKTIIVFIVAALVSFTIGLWFFSAKTRLNLMDMLPFGVMIIVVGFAVFVGYKRLTSARRGEPAEDELSKKILQRASSTAYYISIYMWLVFIYLSDKTKLETHTLIGAGILGMAVIFCICWIIFNFRGIRNE